MKRVVDLAHPASQALQSESTHTPEQGARVLNRTPWNGNLNDSELSRPGGLLVAALVECANERRQQMNEMAAELGVTYGYISQLRTGVRKTSQVSDEFVTACAAYLMVPRLTVLMLAGRVTVEDYFETEQTAASAIPRAFQFVCTDPHWGPLVTPEVRLGSLQTQFLVIRLYERATGTVLLDAALDEKSLVAEIAQLNAVREARRKDIDAWQERNLARKHVAESDSPAA